MLVLQSGTRLRYVVNKIMGGEMAVYIISIHSK